MFSNISFVSFFLLLLVFSLHVCYTFCSCPRFFFLAFISLLFSLNIFYSDILKLRHYFLSCVQSNKLIKVILYFCYKIFCLQPFFLVLSQNFHLCAQITYLFLHAVLLYHQHNNHRWFFFFLKSWSDNSNILVISQFGSDHFSVSSNFIFCFLMCLIMFS